MEEQTAELVRKNMEFDLIYRQLKKLDDSKASIDDFEKYVSETRKTDEKIISLKSMYLRYESNTNDQLSRHYNRLEENEKDIVSIKVKLNKHLKEWMDYLSYSENTATNNINKFEASEKSIDFIKSELELIFRTMSEITTVSATKIKVTQIEKRLNEFASIEHVKTLKEFLLPKIEDFSNKVDDF